MIKYFSNEFDWLMVKRNAIKLIDEQVKNNDLLYGKSAIDFQEKLKKFLNVKYIILTKSGTQSLVTALKCYGIGNGDKVITTPLTFIATINAIRLVGADPIFVDVKKDTWNIDENKIEEKIDNSVKAIISVDIFGNPCNYDKINEIGKKYNIPIIDDMCQAMTSEYHGNKLGSLCDISCTSFYPTKPFGGFGEGGAFITNNEEIYIKAKCILNHGSDNNDNCIRIGTNGKFDMLHGVFLNEKMKYINNILQKRNEIANIYKKMKNVLWQKQEQNSISAWARMQGIVTDEKSKQIIQQLFEIDNLYSKDICDNTLYKKYRKDTPNSEYITHNSISFPIYTYMNINDLKNAVEKYNNMIEG